MTSLHILYTANLNGNIELLPRLHTFMRHLKSTSLDDENDVMLCMVEPVQTRWLLLDLGGACDPAVWHCAATEGRSMLIALDAMGYQAANVDGVLSEESRERLSANLMGMALVDCDHTWQDGDVVAAVNYVEVGLQARPALPIELSPSPTTHLDGQCLHLAVVQAGQVGRVGVALGGRTPQLLSVGIYDIPVTALPDPTIAGTVDFILGEARYFQSRKSP